MNDLSRAQLPSAVSPDASLARQSFYGQHTSVEINGKPEEKRKKRMGKKDGNKAKNRAEVPLNRPLVARAATRARITGIVSELCDRHGFWSLATQVAGLAPSSPSGPARGRAGGNPW